MTFITELKEEVIKEVDNLKQELFELSRFIHSNPELGLKEYKACKKIAEILKVHKFKVKIGIAGLPTALRAEYPGKAQGYTIAFLAEYDALPEVGHGCGHNIIASASTGAALALSKLMHKLNGKIVLLGTPGEEGKGGKVIMLKKGIFKNIDAALMIHPSDQTIVAREALAVRELKIEFYGRTAHSASEPELGINALDAVIQTFNSINALRQHVREDVRIHGIITKGGVAPNIVPEYASAQFLVRALDDKYVEEVLEKVKNCASAAAKATGAKLRITMGIGYKAKKVNKNFYELFRKNLLKLGIKTKAPPKHGGLGSSDIGDVSQVLPLIHPYLAITRKGTRGHSKEFAKAAISKRGYEACLLGAKALAMTAIDLLTTNAMEKVKEEFRRR
ncbi:MAG: M20 family metallopeptidase [Candidatus Thermoplasmatota archaeon]|nr:M20 family metallopeptidase [Candidatus Thermoplasmatota archaeon]